MFSHIIDQGAVGTVNPMVHSMDVINNKKNEHREGQHGPVAKTNSTNADDLGFCSEMVVGSFFQAG